MNHKAMGDKVAEFAGGFLKSVGIAMLVLWLLLCLVLFTVFGLGFNHYLNRAEKEEVSSIVCMNENNCVDIRTDWLS